ncbi:autotransporter outer membrane beta-barrel domain-containing protein [Mixta intestinalis]|uniref:Adhesin/invasin TibA autotransporter n=1 Tax=Mixta intestinalis TaxID=1615494 RepID=A0A6P1Q438_9GAMM|nr:autotransporter outer membrane beta-barrel domain-containing protein [Mixta intestinalis]QHM73393.1 Adhesin/invasin TibA autotransporter [Mixta intestinalis]
MACSISLFKINPLSFFVRQRMALASALSLPLLIAPAAALAADLDAIMVDNGARVVLNDGDRITVIGDEKYLCAICNPVTANNSMLTLGNNVSIDVKGPLASGMMISGKEVSLEANQLLVNVEGRYGIKSEGANNILNLGSGSQINLNGTILASNGIYLTRAASLEADALTINTQGSATGLYITDAGTNANLGNNSVIRTQDNQATGIYIFGRATSDTDPAATLKANQLTIETAGTAAYGINIQSNSEVDLGSQTSVTTQGESAIGIWNLGNLKAQQLHIRTEGSNFANALKVQGEGQADIGAGSTLYSANSGALVASGDSATINFNGNETQRNTIFSGGTYGISAQSSGSQINISWTDIDVTSNADQVVGIWALNGGEINGNNLSVMGNSNTIGAYAMMDSAIDLTGDTRIHMASPSEIAVGTQHDENHQASRINLDGKLDIIGSVQAAGGKITMNMAAGSHLTGATASDGVNGGYLHMKMDQSQWDMPASSTVDRLTLNDSTIDFASGDLGTVLTVGDLTGSGTFALKTDIVAERNDKLVVTGTSEGNHYLRVQNRGDMQTTGNEVLTLVETQDGQARFALSPNTSRVELGGYLYDLRQAGGDWQLYASGTTPVEPEEEDPLPPPDPQPTPDPDPTPEPTPDPTPDPVPNPDPSPGPDADISNPADAGANFLNVSYLINYAEMQTMLQRFGDLRQTDHVGDGWIRGIGGRFDDFASGKLSGFSMSYSGLQFGVDKQISPDLPIALGVFMGVTNGNAHYASGSGDQKSSHAGFYASGIADNGIWLDGVFKYSRMKSSFNVKDSQSQQVSGEGAADNYSVSLEGGKRFDWAQSGQGFYLEPQLQVAWSHQQSDTFRASNGLRIDLESYNSLLGRASGLVGYRMQQSDMDLNVYLKSGIVREFKGDTGYRLNGSQERHSFKGNWWNNGLGVSAQIADKHVIYLEGDLSTGNKFDQRQFSGGYRFTF